MILDHFLRRVAFEHAFDSVSLVGGAPGKVCPYRKGNDMTAVNPFHSSLEKRVYHDQRECTEGNNIEARYRVDGKGGLPRCSHCARI